MNAPPVATPRSAATPPALAFWFVLTRLSRLEADAITDARGLAILRWRSGPEDEWAGPTRSVTS